MIARTLLFHHPYIIAFVQELSYLSQIHLCLQEDSYRHLSQKAFLILWWLIYHLTSSPHRLEK